MKPIKPLVDEARGRRFAKAMETQYGWRELTGRQLEQVLNMAEEYHGWMRMWRKRREDKP